MSLTNWSITPALQLVAPRETLGGTHDDLHRIRD
jgi:hypothetical protein